HKAAGPDQLKPLVLQRLRDVIAPILQVIFQKSLDTGRVPKDWTTAYVCPLFKKGDTSLASNYRPISLTSILCKVLEHIVTTNVVSHMDQHNLLYDLQHGFRTKRSCETQLVTLIEDLMRNSIAGSQTDLVLLDFSKAFDKVSHQKLLLKLHKYGIRGLSLKWIQAFLSGRTQTVVLENEQSETVPVTSGVPQGSVLGPILFLIYINDLPDRTRSKVRLFADDTAIYLAVSSLQDAQVLQKDLDCLHEWELQWDMEFNPSKCVVIHVTRARTPFPSEYLLHGQILESVEGSKYLGVEISSNLSFSNHIQKTCTTASRSLGFIKRNIRTKSPAIREMAYKTLVRPLVEYSSSVWSPYTQNNIYKIEMIQRRAARWTLDNYYRQASVTDMLDHLGWRTLEQRRNDSRLCLFYKIVHGLVAIDLPPYVVHPTRISHKNSHPLVYRQIHTRVDYYKYSFYPLAIVQWNRLPSNVALLPTFESFKRAVCMVSHPMP
ncbi:MAG: reverse transcriptase family protein, partial [Candidatus Thiodiazotropha endolucinida]|nr:reverse transcriptase family protein [Candidatus Thiodiazotropha taylori]MCW4263361.1 reverse transcriptase family protein [Candidatus Thiodiazotropha endolucinida]